MRKNLSNVCKAFKTKNGRIIAMLLALVIVVGGAFAFLTANDSKNNVFTIGRVDIELHENFNGSNDVTDVSPAMSGLIPGQTVQKEPWIKNTGENDAWTYLVVGVPYGFAADVQANNYTTHTIPVYAFGIQDHLNDVTTSAATWSEYHYSFPGSGTEISNKEDAIQLFELKNINTEEWTKLEGPYFSDDGHIYYAFGRKTLLSKNDRTESLFTEVRYIPDIGETTLSGNYVTIMRHATPIAYIPITYTLNTSNGAVSVDPSTTPIDLTVYTDSDPHYQGLCDVKKEIQPDSVEVSDLLMVYKDPELKSYIVANPNPVLYSVYDNTSTVIEGDKRDVPVKLIPSSQQSTAVINRGFVDTPNDFYAIDGKAVVETYQMDIINQSPNEFVLKDSTNGVVTNEEVAVTYSDLISKPYWSGNYYDTNEPGTTQGMDLWFVYGLKENCMISELSSFVKVQGKGYMVVSNTKNGFITTGSVISVYRDETNELVERFSIVIYGDLDHDGAVTPNDSTTLRNELAGSTEWFWLDSSSFDPAVAIAADINKDGALSGNDSNAIYCQLNFSKKLNQINSTRS